MAFRRAKTDAHHRARAWQEWIARYRAELTAIGLPPVAYRHFLEPPHRLDWDFVAERQRAICYDAGRQVVR